ncbi:MAG: hypothetical protein KME20_25290 [Kaiparowitsia implicata GSE-PSE-MK54-09C]|jgi:hypothetical protein|nr:hypothetical protein [Kaiparowitsia implicata GSE-PSE-MK54-09C]
MNYRRRTARPLPCPTQSRAIALRADALSPRNLDLVSLAVCSCVLTLLVHGVAQLPTSSALNKPTSQSSGITSPTLFQAFTVPGTRPKLKQDEE